MSTKEKSEIIPFTERFSLEDGAKVIDFSYSWSAGSLYENSDYESPFFSPGCDRKLTWRLKLGTTQTYGIAKLHLCLLPCNIPKMIVRYKWHYKNHQHRESYKSPNQSSAQYVSSQSLTVFDSNSSVTMYPRDEFDVSCYVTLVIPAFPAKNDPIKVPECQLLDNMANLLGDQKFSDVTIKVSEQKFFAHKAVLAMRSRVFSAMFEHKMAENLENVVEITDMEPDVCGEMLLYIYTGRAPKIKTMAANLLMAAEKYELERLKLMCSETLRTNLNINNAVETLILADLYNATLLKTRAAELISINIAAVFETEVFQKMTKTHPNLVTEVLKATAMNIKSKAEKSLLCNHGI